MTKRNEIRTDAEETTVLWPSMPTLAQHLRIEGLLKAAEAVEVFTAAAAAKKLGKSVSYVYKTIEIAIEAKLVTATRLKVKEKATGRPAQVFALTTKGKKMAATA